MAFKAMDKILKELRPNGASLFSDSSSDSDESDIDLNLN